MTVETKRNFIINVIFISIISIILIFSIKFLFVYLFPVIIGTVITIIVQRPAEFITTHTKIKKGYAALFLVIFIYLILSSAISFLVFRLLYYIGDLASSNIEVVNQISDVIDRFVFEIEGIVDKISPMLADQIGNIIDNIVTSVCNYISVIAKKTATSMPLFITGTIVTILASCYIAKDFDRFKCSISSVISKKYKIAILRLRDLLRDNVLKLFIGYLKLLGITFLELTIGLLLLQADNAILTALLIAFLDLLPIFGTGTVLVPWGIYNIIISNYFFGIGLIILYIVVTLVRSIIEPKIIGGQMGLHPLIALIAVFLGLRLFGFIGIFTFPLIIMLVYKMYENGIFEILLNRE